MPDVKIDIDIQKTGAGAQQAKQELDQLKDSAAQAAPKVTDLGKEEEKTGLKASELRFKLFGFHAILGGVTQLLRGGADAFYGLSRAISGVVMVLSNTVWGRLAQIAAILIGLGLSLYNYFRPAQEEIKKTDDALKNLDKTQKDLVEPALRTAAEYAKQLADEFDRAAEAAARTRKNADELSDAELALKLATIDRRVASGEITEEQGKQERIESRLAHEQVKNTREKEDIQNNVAAAEKNIADAREEYESAQKNRDQKQAEYIKQQVASSEKFPLIRSGGEDYTGMLGKATTMAEFNAIRELGQAKKNVEGAETGVNTTASAYYAAQAKYSPIVESGKSRLKTLDTLSQASEVNASAQSIANANAITKKQVEEEKKKLAEIAATEKENQSALKEHEKNVFNEEKSGAISEAEQILDQQRAEEQVAKIQLNAAERAAGAKGLSSTERKQRAGSLQSARIAYGKESADVSQAEAYVGKIRETVDPAALANLIHSIESLGNNVTAALNQAAAAVNNVNSKVSQQSSQLKNGGLRTK